MASRANYQDCFGDIKRYPEPIHSHYHEMDYETILLKKCVNMTS